MEMNLCHDWGMPHSEFMEWDQEDQAKAIAFFLEKAERCSMCGTARWEWNEDKFAYEAVEDMCPGCMRKETMQEESGHRMGVSVILVPANTREARQRRAREAKRWAERE